MTMTFYRIDVVTHLAGWKYSMNLLTINWHQSYSTRRQDFQAVKSGGFLYSLKLTDIEGILVEIVIALETEWD